MRTGQYRPRFLPRIFSALLTAAAAKPAISRLEKGPGSIGDGFQAVAPDDDGAQLVARSGRRWSVSSGGARA